MPIFLLQVPSGPGQPYKFTVLETCDRIKEEFNYVQQQCHQYVLIFTIILF